MTSKLKRQWHLIKRTTKQHCACGMPRHLSKKSPLMMALGDLGKLPKEQRAEIGKCGNEVKRALEAAFAEKEQAIQTAAAVGTDISLSDLKGTLVEVLRQMFGADRQVRLRSSYFPFTEPSIEADLQCTVCDGAGCGLCKYTGWLEIVPGGMIHPQVLRNSGVDPEHFQGFAFGAGLDRLAALQYSIRDIRYLYENDMRFLWQF